MHFVHQLAAQSETRFYYYAESLNQTSLAYVVFVNTSGGEQLQLYCFKNLKLLHFWILHVFFPFLVPSSGPGNVSAFATTSSSILVRWGDVQDTDRNGLILGYKVHCKLVFLSFDFELPRQ